ncbi:hypothetical protein ASPFODRAFT_212367 [Aspergillus luchuensis CBS 106.47]|uniref:Uncharacterized protein n=1 Tax=Aspergillus luchuensis (strain CBS 106.47) TaxID=1137211 RepID=A0A1M3T1L1_ASPLC|nr:hypothetical protein ASPFODRAFT_212367 [Aspergillus luchuensis CBS 106.47]
MREGVEAVVFVGGVSLGYPATAFPLPVFTGMLTGVTCGYLIYRGSNAMSIQLFLITSICMAVGSNVAGKDSGPGFYNIRETVWHVNCCNAETDNS